MIDRLFSSILLFKPSFVTLSHEKRNSISRGHMAKGEPQMGQTTICHSFTFSMIGERGRTGFAEPRTQPPLS